MVSIYDVEARKLIEALAKELEKMPEMAPPEWANYVKTGVHNLRPPAEEDWWYIRSAAILRSIYKLGPIGVSKLRTKYGGRKNRGHKPDKTFKASGNIIRKILQKLELIGFVKQTEKGTHKGRIVTPKGFSFVDKLVVKIKVPYVAPNKESAKPAKKEVKKEETKVEIKEIKSNVDKKPSEKKSEVKKEVVEQEKVKEEVNSKVEVKSEEKEKTKPEVKKEVVEQEKVKEEVKPKVEVKSEEKEEKPEVKKEKPVEKPGEDKPKVEVEKKVDDDKGEKK